MNKIIIIIIIIISCVGYITVHSAVSKELFINVNQKRKCYANNISLY